MGRSRDVGAPPRLERGLALVELALTLPVLLLLLAGIIQFGGLFYVENLMVNVARDEARKLAVGEVTPSQVQTNVKQAFASWTPTFTCVVTMPTSPSKDVSVEIKVPKASVSLMDIFGMFKTGDLTAKVVMRQEDTM